jgi:hypothetical protein
MTLPTSRLLALEPRQLTLDDLEAHAFAIGTGVFVERHETRYELRGAGMVLAWAPLGGAA